jgi:hypothetical protein
MIAFSLVVLEIRVLYADQAKRDSDVTASRQLEVDRFQQIMIRFDQQQKLPELIQAANQRVAKLPAAQVSPRPVDKLKRDATLLSQEILQFLTDRVRGEPSLVPGGTDAEWKQNTESYLLYSRDTMSLYSQQFAARVIATRNAFAERGLTDKELDSIYEHPTNPIGIRMVGEHMGALAEKIH